MYGTIENTIHHSEEDATGDDLPLAGKPARD
jgi:hypothetical protein